MQNTNTRQPGVPNESKRFVGVECQGRDFSLLEEVNHLRNAEMSVEGNCNNIDGIIGNNIPKDDFEAKSMLEQLEYYKAQVSRNAVPVDGKEPPPERGL